MTLVILSFAEGCFRFGLCFLFGLRILFILFSIWVCYALLKISGPVRISLAFFLRYSFATSANKLQRLEMTITYL